MADNNKPPTSKEELLARYAKGERDFRNAELSDAYLTGADLGGAQLIDRRLWTANPWAARIDSRHPRGAHLSGAKLANTLLPAVSLAGVVGADAVVHLGPSVLDHRTIELSGMLPVAFLRGVGLSDWQIEAARLNQSNLTRDQVDEIVYAIANARAGRALNLQSVFISYSTADEPFTRRLHDDLQNAGVRCWFFPEDGAGGKKLHEQLAKAIHLHDRLLLCLSETSMASRWVRFEIERARDREEKEGRRVLFPIRLVPYEKLRDWPLFDSDHARGAAKEIREYFIPDFSGWHTDRAKYQDELARLIKDLTTDDPPKP